MEDISKKVKTIRTKIEEVNRQRASLEGRQIQVLESLEKSFGIKSIEEALQEIDKSEAEIKKQEEKLQKLLTELDEKAKELK